MTARWVRFGPFAFDAVSGELVRDGRRVRLQRQPARLLEILLTHSGELVSREEIRRALWGDEVHVDFERSLNFCVRKLRLALDDDADSPRFVETVPTRGYRFIAATKAEATEHPAMEHTATEHTATEHTAAEHTEGIVESWRFRARVASVLKWAAAGVLLLAAVAGLFVGFQKMAEETPKIVVIPFHNETGSPDFDRVAKGVSDAAVVRLASPDRLSHLRVIGNATDVFFSFRPRDMKAMGHALGAQYLVLGQLKRDNTRFRVIAHLIRVSDQTHVWATTFDRETLDLSTQAEIAEAIAKAVSAHVPS